VSWNDYALLDTVVLVKPDCKVTSVDFSAGTQIISGSKVIDQDGERTASILFSDSTSASMVLEDSTEIPLESMNVRITEYSVGKNGVNTMPAVLPPASAYTYCFSVTADEAIASNAKNIKLDKPAIFYLNNFLLFPAGTRIPVGQIDREKRIWIPKPDGIVLSVVDTINNKAVISAEPGGAPADSAVLDSLGIDESELIKIAGLYSPGESFWRTEVDYFGIVDCNFAASIIENSETPVLPIEKRYIKELINQPLTKKVDITGSKFDLTFQSDRQIGNIPEINIQLSNNSIPAGLNYISLEIEIAGRDFYYEFQALPDLKKTFVWDGKDAFGRVIPGKHKAKIEVGYLYQGKYQWPADMAASFAAASGTEIPTVYSRERIVRKQEYTVEIPLMDNRLMGLGGWNLSPFHGFDLNENILYYGNGLKRESVRMGKDVIIAAGNVHGISFTEGMIATKPNLGTLYFPEVAEDGTVYFFASPYSIYKVTPDGRLHKVAGGTGRRGSERNDGHQANGTRIGAVNGIALDKEGSIYFTEGDYHLIRKIDKSGILSTIAGTQVSGYTGDGGLAINAGLANPGKIEVMENGTIYFSDQTNTYNNNNCIRKIGTDGIITTVAGGGIETDYTKFPAAKLKLYPTLGLTKDKNDNIYFTTQQNFYGNQKTSHKLFKLNPDGWLTNIAGN
jgi:hypothetical protein